MNTHDATTTMVDTAVLTQRQYSAATAAMMPPGVGPEATLEVAQALLHNPPGLHASPSAAEQ
jgi:hypothetical protein